TLGGPFLASFARSGEFLPVPLRRRGLELLTLLFQKSFYFHGRHATSARGGDRLAITPILHVPARVNSVYASENVVVGLKITVGIGVELAGKHLRVGLVANAKKQR